MRGAARTNLSGEETPYELTEPTTASAELHVCRGSTSRKSMSFLATASRASSSTATPPSLGVGHALHGALALTAASGGGLVEGYPHDTGGKRKSVLHNGSRTLFERAGFDFVRPEGMGNCVMRRTES